MARKKKGIDVHGWVVVDKPKGLTSNQVVTKVRRFYDAKKAGHTGTLDPFATGVLPIALGEATKLVSYVVDGMKEYEFVIKFGIETNTDDIEGEVLSKNDLMISKDDILKTIPDFLGKIEQIPSAFSAIKINGERAYKLARQGQDVEIPCREIEIYELELIEMLSENRARMRVLCSKGTYVRTLGKDFARKMNTVAHLEELRRIRTGVFSLNDKILLENLENIGYKEKALLPINASLRDIAVLAISEADAIKLKQGQSVSPRNYDISGLIDKDVVAVFDGVVIAIVGIDERRISAIRVLNI